MRNCAGNLRSPGLCRAGRRGLAPGGARFPPIAAGPSAPAPGYPANAQRQHNGDADHHDPPHRDGRRTTQAIGDGEGDADGHRDTPIVADDEVVPERPERTDLGDHERLSLRGAAGSPATDVDVLSRRKTATNPKAYSATAGMRTRSAASAPGQWAPAPSAPQYMPNVVSMTPTTNFMLFSGTRDNGARTAQPATVTVSTAAIAAIAASPMSC